MSCWDIDQKQFLSIKSMWSWPLTHWPQKSVEVISWPKAMHLWSLNVNGPWVVQLLIGTCCYIQDQCDRNLWPPAPKINRGHLLAKANVPMQFEGQGLMGCQVIDRKPFYLQGQYDLNRCPIDPKINSKTNALTKFEWKYPIGCQVIDKKIVFTYKVDVTLAPWPLNQ
jgi:hypothetical protein